MDEPREFAAVLADEASNMIVFACSEPLEANRLIRFAGRRFRVLRPITRQEFDAARSRNAEVRKRYGRADADHQCSMWGDTPETLKVVGHPPAPPEEAAKCYVWAEEI